MTKLEELKAAYEAVSATFRTAVGNYEVIDAARSAAKADFAAAWDAREAAWYDYQDELRKTQKENN
jgi:Arc/MetJ family transcription regulator